MTLICSALIPSDAERGTVCQFFVKKFATSYANHDDKKELHATFVTDDQEVINAVIQQFEKYSEHTIVLHS